MGLIVFIERSCSCGCLDENNPAAVTAVVVGINVAVGFHDLLLIKAARRVALRIFRTVFSALSGTRLLACLIVAPQWGYDETKILSCAIRPFCPTSADGLYPPACWREPGPAPKITF